MGALKFHSIETTIDVKTEVLSIRRHSSDNARIFTGISFQLFEQILLKVVFEGRIWNIRSFVVNCFIYQIVKTFSVLEKIH
jgi:hypothetical protein